MANDSNLSSHLKQAQLVSSVDGQEYRDAIGAGKSMEFEKCVADTHPLSPVNEPREEVANGGIQKIAVGEA